MSLFLWKSGKMRFVEAGPRSQAFISLHAWQRQFISCNFASMGKKKRGINLSMLFTEIYGSLGMLMWLALATTCLEVTLVSVYLKIKPLHFLQHWYSICFCTMVIFGRIVCHISGGFPRPLLIAFTLNIFLCVCPDTEARRLLWSSALCPGLECLSLSLADYSLAQIYLMHPHRELLKSIFGVRRLPKL